MAEQDDDTPTLSFEPFKPDSETDVSELIQLFQGYLLEEFDRIGELPPGLPAGGHLNTIMIKVDGAPVGFAAADVKRCSVEVIYVDKAHRGSGIALITLLELRQTCPRPMEAKTPLSPGGEALAARLGLGLAHSTPDELAAHRKTMDELHWHLDKFCKHKRAGDPRRRCNRCYRVALKRYAAVAVGGYATEARAVRRLLSGVPRLR